MYTAGILVPLQDSLHPTQANFLPFHLYGARRHDESFIVSVLWSFLALKSFLDRNYWPKLQSWTLNVQVHLFDEFSAADMELILDGNFEIKAQVLTDLGYLICIRHLFRSRGVTNLNLLFHKRLIFLHTFATCSNLPSYLNTMALTDIHMPGSLEEYSVFPVIYISIHYLFSFSCRK